MFVQTLVCFANSRKNGHRCVAGKTWSRQDGGAWVRPVSGDSSRAIDPAQLAYQNGEQPSVLDIIDVPFDAPLPEGHQTENTLLNANYFWTKRGRLTWSNVADWTDTPHQLWANNDQSYGMRNNRVSVYQPVNTSLQLVSVPHLRIRLMDAPNASNRNRRVVVGEFNYNGVDYRIHVTDTEMETRCRANPWQPIDIKHSVICLSLGARFGEHYYKLIASVLFDRRYS